MGCEMELTEIFSLAPIGSICIETFGTVVYQKIGESEFVPHSEATIDLNESVARYKKLTEEYEAKLKAIVVAIETEDSRMVEKVSELISPTLPTEPVVPLEPVEEPLVEDVDLTLIERKEEEII